jgi:hypothetical protein
MLDRSIIVRGRGDVSLSQAYDKQEFARGRDLKDHILWTPRNSQYFVYASYFNSLLRITANALHVTANACHITRR